MTEVENQTLNLLKTLIENKDKIFESINEAKEKLIPTVNIINILGNTYSEVPNSSLLHNLLKIKFKYDNKEINFAKDFSEYVIKEKLKNYSVDINSTAEAFNEFYASSETWRRIDLLIKADNFEIIIENKIWAGDQENQLKDYYKNRVENKNNDKIKDNIFIVYLTSYGYKPSEFSIDKELREDLENKNKICYLSHDNIAEWIENDILNKYEFLKFDKKYQSIYSALIQIRDNEKIITNPNRENNMEKEEIKKFFEENNYFETLLKDVNDVDKKVIELNTFHELLENAQKVISDKMDALAEKFYEKIKEEPQEYEKVKLIADMYNSLTITRINSLIERFEGGNHANACFYRDFPSEKRGTNYAVSIYVNNYQYSHLLLFSREQIPDKFEQDNKDIEAWLKKHNLFEGFYFDGRWIKKFKFPEEEKKLYEYTEKLIKCLEEDIESIYSGK